MMHILDYRMSITVDVSHSVTAVLTSCSIRSKISLVLENIEKWSSFLFSIFPTVANLPMMPEPTPSSEST